MPFGAQQKRSQGKTNLGAEETQSGMRLAAVEQWKLTVLLRVSVTVIKKEKEKEKEIEKCDQIKLWRKGFISVDNSQVTCHY